MSNFFHRLLGVSSFPPPLRKGGLPPETAKGRLLSNKELAHDLADDAVEKMRTRGMALAFANSRQRATLARRQFGGSHELRTTDFFRYTLLILLTLCYLYVTTACTPNSLGIGGSSGSSEEGGGEEDGTAEEAGSGTGTGDDGTGGSVAPASIPAPVLIKAISFNEDTSAYDPTVFYEGAIDTSGMTDSNGDGYVDDYWMALSETSLEVISARNHNPPWSPLNLRGENQAPPLNLRGENQTQENIPPLRIRGGQEGLRKSWGELIMRNAQATSLSVTDNAVCSQEGVTCCEISMSGDTICYPSFSSSTYYAAVTDGTNIGDQITLTQNEHLLWLANVPSDVTGTGDQAFSITDGVAVKIADDGGTLRVNGDHSDTTAYRAFDVSGTNLAYDSTNSYLGIIDSSTGVTALDLTGTLVASRTVDGATAYTKIKTATNNEVYFGAEVSSETEGWVYDYYNGYAAADAIDWTSSDDIQFIASGDLDSSGVQMMHAKTIVFDVNSDGYALVVYQDIAGNTRIRASNYTYDNTSGVMFGGESPLVVSGSSPDFKDLHFINDTQTLLIDSANDMVWIITMDTSAQTVTSTLSSSNGISVGDSPVAVKFNADKSRAYVLNQGDESLSVINLRNSDSSVRSSLQVVLTSRVTDVVSNIDLSFTPTSLAWVADSGSLIVGLEGTKALLVMDASDLTSAESTLSDEDNDSDGYTGAEGDCDDTSATLNPTTVWYADADSDTYGNSSSTTTQCEQPSGYVSNSTDCDDDDSSTYPGASELCDSVDNDCDGTTDEDTTSVTWYRDADGDTYGNASVTTSSCSRPSVLWVTNSSDCDDTTAAVSPADSEVCDDSIDNDCDGDTDEGCDDGNPGR